MEFYQKLKYQGKENAPKYVVFYTKKNSQFKKI